MPSASVCIISDTHGYIDPRITSLVEASDYVLHAGDIGNAEVLNQLRPRVAAIAVLGNNDYEANWPEADHETLHRLSWKAELQLPGGLVSLEHGDRVNPVATRHQKLRQRHPDARVVVYGHSHELTIDQSEPIWILNPGAAGKERTKGGPSCLMLVASDNSWNVTKYRFEKTS